MGGTSFIVQHSCIPKAHVSVLTTQTRKHQKILHSQDELIFNTFLVTTVRLHVSLKSSKFHLDKDTTPSSLKNPLENAYVV